MSCTVVVLAAQRTGVVNPLAERAGVSHKCLAPIAGKPLIVHVMDLIAQCPEVAKVRVMVEPDGQQAHTVDLSGPCGQFCAGGRGRSRFFRSLAQLFHFAVQGLHTLGKLARFGLE